MTLLRLDNICVSYGAVQALDRVSLNVQAGTIVALVGSNGAGKSSLMRSILGLVPVSSGNIFFQGQSLLKMKSHEIVASGVACSPEGRQIFADMTVDENLLLGAYAKKMTKHDIQQQRDNMFALFPILAERISKPAGVLSGGEQQMLAIARALMSSPQLLLLDEPSLGISPLLAQKIFAMLVQLSASGTAILLAEQNAAMALKIAQHGYILEVGRVVHNDVAHALVSNDVVRKAYLGVI